MRPLSLCLLVAVAAPSVIASRARAAELPCPKVDPDVIHVDGLAEDWRGVPAQGGGGDDDLDLAVRCNQDERTLYLLIEVKDERLVRSPGGGGGDDQVGLGFAGPPADRLIILPQAGKLPHRVRWASGHAVKEIDVAESRTPSGWQVEARLPLANLPGWAPGAALVPLTIEVADADQAGKSQPEAHRTIAATVELSEAAAHLAAFLADRRLERGAIAFDRPARLLPGRLHRVVIAGRYLATIGEEYTYLALPIAAREDLQEARLVDLAGDGRQEVMVRYREQAPSGGREVLAIYQLAGEGLRRRFGIEVAKRQGERRLSAKVSLVPQKKKIELLVEAEPAQGWTEASYREAPEQELLGIPLPWGHPPRVRVRFDGEQYQRLE